MGSGLTNPPDSPSGSIPDIPVPNYTQQAQQWALGMKAAGFWDEFWKAFWEHVAPGAQAAVSVLASAIDSIFSVGLGFIGKLQGANTPGFFTLLNTALSDLTGVEFPSSATQFAFSQGGVLSANKQIGSSFLNMLVGEMAPAGAQTPQSGFDAAAAFLGYGMAFAIREANIAMLVEFLPEEIRFMEGLREYGTALADSLSLGRLTRLVMAPMMKILVQDPLTWYFNQKYTPTLLPVASMFKANWRGGMTAQDLSTYLGYLGYSPTAAEQLAIDAAMMPAAAEYINQFRTNYINSQDLGEGLAAVGIPPNVQASYLQGVESNRSAAHLDATVSAYLNLYRNRWIEEDDLQTQLKNLGLSPQEMQWAMYTVAPYLEYTTKELGQGEIEDAYIKGLVDINYYAAWATRQGYSLPDQQILQYLLLLKQNADTSAEQLNAWKLRISCLNAIAKGQPAPPGFDSKCNPS